MKTFTLTLFALCASVSLTSASLTVSDDFNDNSIDPTKWNALDLTTADFGAGQAAFATQDSVTEVGGALRLQGRGYLNTVDAFDPSIVGQTLVVAGEWTFGQNTDFMQILTRTNGDPVPNFGETGQGIEFRVRNDNNNIEIAQRTNFGLTNINGTGAVPFGVNTGTSYGFLITDNGTDLRFTFFETLNPLNTVTATATATGVSASNLVTFHNREGSSRFSTLDNVSIALVPEPGTALGLLGVAVLSMLTSRRRRRLA